MGEGIITTVHVYSCFLYHQKPQWGLSKVPPSAYSISETN